MVPYPIQKVVHAAILGTGIVLSAKIISLSSVLWEIYQFWQMLEYKPPYTDTR